MDFFDELGLEKQNSGVASGGLLDAHGAELACTSPIDGQTFATVTQADASDYERVLSCSVETFARWRLVPAPVRGDLVRQIGLALREKRHALAKLVSVEMGKILSEAEGEVQEMIDIADFAVGLSRQLYGLQIASERPLHRLAEQWHPLGPVGIISAFNFPVAVWSWNAFIAAVCGDTMIWKPSSKTALCAVAAQRIADDVLSAHGFGGVMGLVVGPSQPIGELLLQDERVPLVSATGSCRMGRRVAEVVGTRFGRTLLELGGNNALIVMPDADMDLALRAVVFGAIGTTGQRCTSTRRLLLHSSIAGKFVERLLHVYAQLRVGSPLNPETLVGPLIDQGAVRDMQQALTAIREQGGEVLCGGEVLTGAGFESGCYVRPALVRASPRMPIVLEETFAPILYVMSFDTLDQAIAIQNGVSQGLSSSIFTNNLRTAEVFLSATGSDCGIANVNVGTSGAEIGGAFGGEKHTGGGREAGSDSWKAYMRRQTQTINFSNTLPLAQGIRFGA